jgi:hypothetical protein
MLVLAFWETIFRRFFVFPSLGIQFSADFLLSQAWESDFPPIFCFPKLGKAIFWRFFAFPSLGKHFFVGCMLSQVWDGGFLLNSCKNTIILSAFY